MQQIIHIVSSDFVVKTLQNSFAINPALQGDIIALSDRLAVGPVTNLDTAGGIEKRSRWMCDVMLKDDTEMLGWWQFPEKTDVEKLERLKSKTGSEKLMLWLGNNSHDRLMFGRFLNTVQPKADDLLLVPISESPIKNVRGHEIIADSLVVLNHEQMAEMGKRHRPFKPEEIEAALALWKKVSVQPGIFRLCYDSTEIDVRPEEWLDKALLQWCEPEFKKAVRIVGEALVDTGFEVSDSTLNWRLRELVRSGQLEYEGKPGIMREYKVRLKSN